MDINSKQRRVFTDLFASTTGLLVYTLYSRYRLEPSEAVEFIHHYQQDGIISIDANNRLQLTLKGRESIGNILDKIISSKEVESDYFDEQKVGNPLALFEPFLPDVSFVNKYHKMEEKGDVSASK